MIAPALALLRRVPWWAWVMAALLAWGGWHRWRAIDARAEFQRAQQAAQAEHAAQTQRDAEETMRRIKAQQEVVNATEKRAAQAAADAASASAAAGRLRARLAAVQADRGAADPAAAAASAPAGIAAGVLADVLGQCVDRVRSLAAYADRAARAGQACEASYDGLTR